MKKPSKHKSKVGGSSLPARRGGVATRPVASIVRAPAVGRTNGRSAGFSARAPYKTPYTTASSYGADDRQAIVLLLLPFLLMAFAIGLGQSLRPGARWIEAAGPLQMPRSSVAETARVQPPASDAAAKPVTAPIATALPAEQASAPLVVPGPIPRLPTTAPLVPLRAVEAALARPELVWPSAAPKMPEPRIDPVTPALVLPRTAPPIAVPELNVAAPTLALPVSPLAMPKIDIALATPVPALEPVAPAMPRTEIIVPEVAFGLPPTAPHVPVPPAAPLASPDHAANVCLANGTLAKGRSAASEPRAVHIDKANFGSALAAAARAQTRDFVFYNDKYRRIAYPMGDVSSFYGVCTDVLVRAYRELGIDLQELVQTTRSGSGDPNIDHRRVDTLRRFFAAHGEALPITDFAENFRPGDIVSYWRPQNRHSRTHIAIVADEIGPSGRPMIIHNRGWGPQIEDGLFVDKITGHYRFTGLDKAKVTPAAVAASGGSSRAGPAVPIADGITAPKLNGAVPTKGQGAVILKSRVQRRREAGLTDAQTTR